MKFANNLSSILALALLIPAGEVFGAVVARDDADIPTVVVGGPPTSTVFASAAGFPGVGGDSPTSTVYPSAIGSTVTGFPGNSGSPVTSGVLGGTVSATPPILSVSGTIVTVTHTTYNASPPTITVTPTTYSASNPIGTVTGTLTTSHLPCGPSGAASPYTATRAVTTGTWTPAPWPTASICTNTNAVSPVPPFPPTVTGGPTSGPAHPPPMSIPPYHPELGYPSKIALKYGCEWVTFVIQPLATPY